MSLSAAILDADKIRRLLRARRSSLSVGRISALTGIDVRRVRRLLVALVGAGFVREAVGEEGPRRFEPVEPTGESRTDLTARAS